ncbi:MAG: GGDEF domain-containing protein [Gammaproteobacteria bacterium]|nr:GGDEF domain-containing protein [Gammaproteobacteria bacterium]
MKRISQTLLEQLQISEIDIQHRKQLLSLEDSDLQTLSKYRYVIENNIDKIVDEFYEHQTEIDEAALLIGDLDTLKRLRAAMRKYILSLFGGYYDANYVNNRLRIGMVHKRIGVEPKLYIAGLNKLKEIIIEQFEKEIPEENTRDTLARLFSRLLSFDTTLVFDTYIRSLVEEIKNARQKTADYAESLEKKVQERTQQLEELVQRDPLTGLYNRRAMKTMLRYELSRSKRSDEPVSAIYFDVDNFKQINDQLGHQTGDEVLSHIGLVLLESVRETDIPCRYGGDEFCIILGNCDVQNAVEVCNKILNGFNNKYPDFSLSIGIAQTGPDEYVDDDHLIAAADKCMYEAKQSPGSQINFSLSDTAPESEATRRANTKTANRGG